MAMSEITLQIRLNGDPIECPAGLSLLQLLELRGYKPQLVVVEFNSEILPRARWADQPVREADAVEVVTIVGGGS
jgi:thiamine biosynthesis protein ThiS